MGLNDCFGDFRDHCEAVMLLLSMCLDAFVELGRMETKHWVVLLVIAATEKSKRLQICKIEQDTNFN